MALMSGALHRALRSAGVPEDLACRAAVAAMGSDPVVAAVDLYIALCAATTPCDSEQARAAALETGHHKLHAHGRRRA